MQTPSPFSSFAFPRQEDPEGAQGNCPSSARLGEEQGTGFLGRRLSHMGAKEEKGPAGLSRVSLFGWEMHILGNVRLPSPPLPTKAWHKACTSNHSRDHHKSWAAPECSGFLFRWSQTCPPALWLFHGREMIRTLDSDALCRTGHEPRVG